MRLRPPLKCASPQFPCTNSATSVQHACEISSSSVTLGTYKKGVQGTIVKTIKDDTVEQQFFWLWEYLNVNHLPK